MTVNTKYGSDLWLLRGLRAGLVICAAATLMACGGEGDPSLAPPPFGGTGSGGGSGGTTSSPIVSLVLSSQTVTAGAPATVTAKVEDAKGVLAGQVVNFSTQGGRGQFSAPSALTNGSGLATVTLVPADAASAGADVVLASVTVNGVSAEASAGFQLTATQVTIESFTADIVKLQPYEQTALTVRLAGVAIVTQGAGHSTPSTTCRHR
jgi:hypothetical protein